jgi:ElaB/YqjD/DUF883 family membrane-anchored ribosome-binding protein
MKTTLEDSTTEQTGSNPNYESPTGNSELKDAVGRMGKSFEASSAAVSEALDEGRISAERLLRRGRDAANDCLEDATDQVMQKPGTAVALAFGVGVLAGVTFGLIALRVGKNNAAQPRRTS